MPTVTFMAPASPDTRLPARPLAPLPRRIRARAPSLTPAPAGNLPPARAPAPRACVASSSCLTLLYSLVLDAHRVLCRLLQRDYPHRSPEYAVNTQVIVVPAFYGGWLGHALHVVYYLHLGLERTEPGPL